MLSQTTPLHNLPDIFWYPGLLFWLLFSLGRKLGNFFFLTLHCHVLPTTVGLAARVQGWVGVPKNKTRLCITLLRSQFFQWQGSFLSFTVKGSFRSPWYQHHGNAWWLRQEEKKKRKEKRWTSHTLFEC